MNEQFIDDMERALEELQRIFYKHPRRTEACRDSLADAIHNLRQAISSQRAGAKQEDERQLDLPLN